MSTKQKLEKLESKAQKVDTQLDNEVTKLKKSQGQVHYPFWFGGSAASMAAVCTHPLDLSTHFVQGPGVTASSANTSQ